MRPEFWQDDVMATLPDPARLFYIGLWNVADDGGWMHWTPAKIGALLYPYRSVATRGRQIETWAVELARAGRLVVYDCGCANIPTLPKHQRISGVQSFTVKEVHDKDHSGARPTHVPRSDKRSPLSHSPVRERNGRERDSEVTGRLNTSVDSVAETRPSRHHRPVVVEPFEETA